MNFSYLAQEKIFTFFGPFRAGKFKDFFGPGRAAKYRPVISSRIKRSVHLISIGVCEINIRGPFKKFANLVHKIKKSSELGKLALVLVNIAALCFNAHMSSLLSFLERPKEPLILDSHHCLFESSSHPNQGLKYSVVE